LASAAVRRVAAERPEAVAIEVDDLEITYAQLNADADRLAQRLLEQGGAVGDRVALRANGTVAVAVGFLAISRAGLVAVQVDPTAPHDRVRTILADVETTILLTDVDGDEALDVLILHPLTAAADRAATPVDRERPEIASIVFTSGSTGVPKGIMLGRRQTDRGLATLPAIPGYDVGARIGGIIGGTVGYVERLIEAALYLEGTLVAYEIRRHGIVPLGSWLERNRIVAISTVPTVLRSLLATLAPEQRFPDLRMVVLTGETTTWEDIVALRPHLPEEALIINSFGLTETGGIAGLYITSAMPAQTGPLPAGIISPDVSVTIVGEDGREVPQGDPGEIVVAAASCSLGYWRRPDLTESRFTVMPDGNVQIATGDGGRIRPDGMLEHLGRIDHLVKISGMRVELGEVEHALAGLDGVAAAAAATYTDDTQATRLTAAVMPDGAAKLDPLLLRASLSRRLPGYMVPDHIAVVDALPQLPGGKTDRRRVAELRSTDSGGHAQADRELSDLERSLLAIWSEVLGTKAIGVDDDFYELGGDSMRASRVFVELERRCGIDRPVSLLAEATTIASLALALSDDAAWTALLAIQTAGTRPPLFVVHDGVGSVLYARGLVAALGEDQPIYAIRCEGLNGQPLTARSLEELAARYVADVQALYPHGPYVLYGVSLGGVIATEIARQLIEAGAEVPLVVLGDSFAPNPRPAPRPLAERRAQRLGELRELRGIARVRRFLWLTRRQLAARIWLLTHPDANRDLDRKLDATLQRGQPVPLDLRGRWVIREYGALLFDYRLRAPYPERLLLLRTDGPGEAPDRGWSDFVGDALEIVDVSGAHNDLGQEASGAYVGPAIAQALDRVPVATT
jgi:acyl-coenzyme A synthetase/AMP-(fatty) acid ligase/thioesterase domain-containing protein/acyl carrier protein